MGSVNRRRYVAVLFVTFACMLFISAAIAYRSYLSDSRHHVDSLHSSLHLWEERFPQMSTSQAEQELDAIIESDPGAWSNLDASRRRDDLGWLVTAYTLRGNYKKAWSWYYQRNLNDSTLTSWERAYELYLAAMSGMTPENFDKQCQHASQLPVWFQKGLVGYLSGNYQEVVRVCNDNDVAMAVSNDPYALFARMLLARSQAALGRYDDAVATFRHIERSGYWYVPSETSNLSREAGDWAEKSGDTELAAELLQSAMRYLQLFQDYVCVDSIRNKMEKDIGRMSLGPLDLHQHNTGQPVQFGVSHFKVITWEQGTSYGYYGIGFDVVGLARPLTLEELKSYLQE
jgi:tetratricopeptide (TPR) repeat protein